MNRQRIYRCAVYTRKSTNDGLEQDFNSLDAQREACEAFVVSQRSQGWKLLPQLYDDGGISGGHMERAGLQHLLADIRSKRIDVVVVYKVDRLTRSLADFARLVDLFDEHDVSFVSVTQQFNTTSSMGRLTLNVLLSFAQFEREVTAERIRDKIAASKKRGKWMGGLPPLGYDNINKKLVVNETEAAKVRQLFDLYLELGNVDDLKVRADQLGLRTKQRIACDNHMRGGLPMSRGYLYQLLSNPVYTGRVKHHDKTYEGEHSAIIGDDIWSKVQGRLGQNAPQRRNARNRTSSHLLKGLVFDETGDRLSPVHTSKKGQMYRYYVSSRLVHNKVKDEDAWRLAADAFEHVVKDALSALFKDQAGLVDMLDLATPSTQQVKTVLQQATKLAAMLHSTATQELQGLLARLIERIDLARNEIVFKFHVEHLYQQLGITGEPESHPEKIHMSVDLVLKKRGVETRLIIGDVANSNNLDPKLIQTIARTHCWFDSLKSGKAGSIREIARKYNLDPGEVSRLLPLAFLSPQIIRAICEGRQPVSLTHNKLIRLAPQLPVDWARQNEMLGF